DERSLTRKVKEASLAVQLEDQLCAEVPKQQCKDRILEQYLNTVYMGRGAYGMQSASLMYFGKPAAAITYADAAVLAGLIQNPNGDDPIRFPERARERRGEVVTRMLDEQLITRQEGEFIKALPVPDRPFVEPRSVTTQELNYVERKIRDELLDAPWLAPTEELRRYLVFNGGLRITTTLDPRAQDLAERAAASNPLKAANPETAVALAAIEPSTGAVRAVVGDTEVPDRGVVEIAAPNPGRSSGSSFKPFTLVAALRAGYSVNSSISGAPAPDSLKKLWGVTESGPYPQDCPTKGSVALSQALAESNNCAFMRLQAAVGFDQVKQTAEDLGLSPTGLDPDGVRPPCFTIGCDALVKPLDMADAYATIANDGRRNPAHFVSKVEDRSGRVLFEYQAPNQEVVSEDVARQAVLAMEKVVTDGTYAGGSLPQGRPAAGKTGTTELEGGKNTDVWFIGFTPQIATAVWIGNPTANSNMEGGRVQGGVTAARVWRSFMAPYTDGTPVQQFAEPRRTGSSRSVPDPWTRYGSSSSSSSSSSTRRTTGTGTTGTGTTGTRSGTATTTPSGRTGTGTGTGTGGGTGTGTGGGTGGGNSTG
ncbi:MAG: transglycosylase domain-containing protein, partial [Microthrixaceae bacterium]